MKPIDKKELREFDKHYKCDEWGRKSRFLKTKENVEAFGLEAKKGRAYKVFVYVGVTEKDIIEQSLIQTYYANSKLAPRVYNIGKKNGYFYIEVECIEGEFKINDYIREKIIKMSEESGFIKSYDVDLGIYKNYIGDKYIDFHGFKLDMKKFKKWLIKEISEKTHWGHLDDKDRKYPYQLDTDLNGKRDTFSRIKKLELDQINYTEQKVLDLGCNLGIFCHYATLNAKRVLGIDKLEIVKLAWLYKYFKYSYSKAEFVEYDVTKAYQLTGFDIVFNFAMVHTIGIPNWLRDITGRLMIFEGHNLQDKNKTELELKKIFLRVRFLGYSEDRGKRPCFWCKK